MVDWHTYFITWTTYGTWLPGDARGWRRAGVAQLPQPLLETWCRERMVGEEVLLTAAQRARVEEVCQRHADIRRWTLHAVKARSNHVHVVVTADMGPKVVRDQLKANASRVLREQPDARVEEKIWSRGGDCEVVDGEENLQRVVQYVMEAQDWMDREM